MQEKIDGATETAATDDSATVSGVGPALPSTKQAKERVPRNAAQQAAAKPPGKQAAKKAYIYLGPNIPGGILFKGGLFKNELPEHLEGTLEKLPEIKKLFVEVKEAPDFKRALEEQGSTAYGLYQYVEQQIRKGALKDGV